MPDQIAIPTSSQRDHDATSVIGSGGDNAAAIAVANDAKTAATVAQSTATDARTKADQATVVAEEAVSAIGNTEIEAAEDVDEFVAITVDGYACDCNSSAHYGHLAGLSVESAKAGFMVPIRRSGLVTNPAWSWTPLATIFCGPGGLTMTPPSSVWTQAIGIAQNDTSMLISLGEPILL